MRYLGGVLLLGLILTWMSNRCFAQQMVEGFLGGQQATYEQISRHLQREEYRKALAVVEPALRTNPSDPVLHELLGDVCANLGQSDRAIDAYTMALQHGSRRYLTYAFRGALYSLRQNWDSAITDFNEAIRIDPKDPHGYYNRAEAYRAKGQYNKARADLETACELSDKGPTLYALVKLLATCPDPEVRDGRKALKYVQKACEQMELNEYFSLNLLAAANAEAGQWDEAIRRTKQALQVAKGDDLRTVRISLELYREHEPDRDFTPEWVDKHASATAGEAVLYALVKDKNGDRLGAILELRKAIARNPRLSEAHFLLGERLFQKHTFEAVSHFSRCLELNPVHSEALAWRGNANLLLGKHQEALNDVEAALRLDPKDPNALLLRPWVWASCGEEKQVLKELEELDPNKVGKVWRHALRGRCYLLQNQFSDAIAELTRALRLCSSDVLAHADRAVAFMALGKDEDAKRDLEECARLAPDMRAITEARMKAVKDKVRQP